MRRRGGQSTHGDDLEALILVYYFVSLEMLASKTHYA